MPTLSDILSRLMFERKIKTAELARQVGIPQPTLHRMVTGVSPNPHKSSLEPLAEFFNITPDQLKGKEPITYLEQDVQLPAGYTRVPIVAWEQVREYLAGDEVEIAENVLCDAPLNGQGFALNMHDSSMDPMFPKDTTLIFDSARTFEDRNFVLVYLAKEKQLVFRQLLVDGGYFYLKPLNPDLTQFPMKLLDEDDQKLGVLVQAKKTYGF